MKVRLILLFIFVFMIGYTINVEDEGYNKISNDKLAQFENNIIIEGNQYESNSIEENIFNKVGKKVDKIIDKGFSLVFKVLKGFADE